MKQALGGFDKSSIDPTQGAEWGWMNWLRNFLIKIKKKRKRIEKGYQN